MKYIKTQLTIIFAVISILALFNLSKFIKTKVANISLPKGKIVFASLVDDDYEIYTINTDGTNLRQLTKNISTTTNTASDDEPSFSPDGKKIVFTSSRQSPNMEIIYDFSGRPIGEASASTRSSDIYIMDVNGNNQKALTHYDYTLDPIFTSDGERILFSARDGKYDYTKIINIDGTEKRLFTDRGGGFIFLPHKSKVIYVFEKVFWMTDFDGNSSKLIDLSFVEKEILNGKNRIGLYNFDVSPDENKIVFVITETTGQSFGDSRDIFRFYTMSIDGSNLEQIYQWEPTPQMSGFISHFRYTPDGSNIIFINNAAYDENIYSLNLKTRTLANLTKSKTNWRDIDNFEFTLDGKRILFIADIYNNIHFYYNLIWIQLKYMLFHKKSPFSDNKYICIMDIDGKNFRKIARLPISSDIGFRANFIHWNE